MRWSVALPGQPVSWDQAYPMGKMPVRRKTGPVLNADGSQKFIHRPVKSDEAKVYQEGIIPQVRVAKPTRWDPKDRQVRVIVDLFLTHWIDCDNATKLVFDAAAKAIGCDDKVFMPCYRRREIVHDPRKAGVVLTFDDDLEAH